jgi:hypothetical protein
VPCDALTQTREIPVDKLGEAFDSRQISLLASVKPRTGAEWVVYRTFWLSSHVTHVAIEDMLGRWFYSTARIWLIAQEDCHQW